MLQFFSTVSLNFTCTDLKVHLLKFYLFFFLGIEETSLVKLGTYLLAYI